ncbi:MAG TPA: glycosyltransferase family 4 protein, partial [Tenericutes bacterium]|nr:glycosyltransferase family 4 protein [Mycoplasmatota bacterium]
MKVVQINTMTNKTNLKSSYYNKRKKHVVVHVEDYFDPSAGYQINELLMLNIKYQDEVHLITSTDMSPFHKDYDEQKDIEFSKKYNVIVHRLEKFFKFSYRIYFRGLFKKIKNINPDLVFLHSIGDFKDLVLWKKKKDYIIVRDCHMSW